VARALSFNGLGNILHIAAINGGTHANPVFAGDTLYAWSEVLDKAEIPGHPDLGALRLRLVATKDLPCADFPYRDADGKYGPGSCSTSTTGASCCAEPGHRPTPPRPRPARGSTVSVCDCRMRPAVGEAMAMGHRMI